VRAFSRFFFHPRILRAVSICSPRTTILGVPSSLPVFVSGAALARLGHPLGEANIARGCGRTGIIQMVSSNASLSPAQISAARLSEDQPLFFQLYKYRDAEARVREVERLGYKAIFLTVDAIVPGNRERDIRAPFELEEQEREIEHSARESAGVVPKNTEDMPRQPPQDEEDVDAPNEVGGTAGALLQHADLDMSWDKVRVRLSIEIWLKLIFPRQYPGYAVSPSYPLS
jgi:L-lactate dehydrogenase (cytochrome)